MSHQDQWPRWDSAEYRTGPAPPVGHNALLYPGEIRSIYNGPQNDRSRNHVQQQNRSNIPMRPPYPPENTRKQSSGSDASTLPYLLEDESQIRTAANIGAATPSSNRPQSSPFPLFIPPQQFQMPPSTQSSPGGVPSGPIVDYHSQAMSVVGAHPSSMFREPERPTPYPVMMMGPQRTPKPKGSVPVERVMARYGQVLPDEPLPPLPRGNLMQRSPASAPNVNMSSSPPELPPPTQPPSGPPPPVPAQVQGGPRHHKLTRRTTSASPTPPPPVPSPVPPALPAPQLQRSPTTSGINTSEEKKRSGSLMRKLTKKRPISLPPAKKHNQPGGVEDRPRPDATRRNEMLPDIQFHARATQDYEMQTYDELGYSLGDIIAVTSADESGKWAGYVVGPAGSRSNGGILYRTYLTLLQRVDSSQSNGNPVFYVEAVYDYRATREDEFNFQAGDIIAVYSTPLGQFWVGANQRARTPSRGKLFPWKLVAPMLAA